MTVTDTLVRVSSLPDHLRQGVERELRRQGVPLAGALVTYTELDPGIHLPSLGPDGISLNTEEQPWQLFYQPPDDYVEPTPCVPRIRAEAIASLNLRLVPRGLREQARAAIEQGDAEGFLILTEGRLGLAVVDANVPQLRFLGLYEVALARALISAPVQPLDELEALVRLADRAKLRAAATPLPDGPDLLTVYRGVAGRGAAERRVRGLSWTLSRECACWFALVYRRERYGLPRPAVHRATVSRAAVLAYFDDRQEQEVLVLPEDQREVRRERLPAAEMRAAAEAFQRRTQTHQQEVA